MGCKWILMIIIGVFLVFGMPLILLFNYESEVIGEQVCVDGSHNKNLEGIMCEKRQESFFGLSEGISGIIMLSCIPLVVLGMVFVFKGVLSAKEESQ